MTKFVLVFGILLLIVEVAVVVKIVNSHAAFEAQCAAAGGHRYAFENVCVEDGRIIELPEWP